MRTAKGTNLRASGVGLALAAVAVLFAACGGAAPSGVASIGSTTTTTVPPALGGGSDAAEYADALRYTDCMRSHGIADFPDPSTQGLAVGKPFNAEVLSRSGVDLNSPQAQTASNACSHLLPAPTTAQRQHAVAEELKYAECMRSHGVPNFPDPTSQGSLGLDGIDPSSPVVQRAEAACQSVAPGILQPTNVGKAK